ncbi:hypothetical protein NC651_030139 [Populus alba x Populus x berolinensis]|nr:hypothetical protein NC651_030139 [Populus alba x Populus x berolinensis]
MFCLRSFQSKALLRGQFCSFHYQLSSKRPLTFLNLFHLLIFIVIMPSNNQKVS